MRIVAAAVLHAGTVYTLPAPARHHDIVRMMADKHGLGPDAMREQGFITDEPVRDDEQGLLAYWVRRVPARDIAIEAGQVDAKKTLHQRELFSEDLW